MNRIAALVIVVPVFIISACGRSADFENNKTVEYNNSVTALYEPANDPTKYDYLLGFSWGGLSESYETMYGMVKDSCKQIGIAPAISESPTNWKQEEQNKCIDSLIDEGAKGILMMPSDPDKGSDKINQLVNKGIPVVCLGGSPAASTKNILTLAPDVYQYSYDATIALLESLNYHGNIIAIAGADTDINSSKKLQAAEDVCNQYYHVNLLQKVKGIDSKESAKKIVGNLLKEYGEDIDGIVALDYYAAHAMASYLKNDEQLKHIKCIGLDTDELILKAISEGDMLGTISQNPMTQAYLGVLTLKMTIDGWTYKEGQPDFVDTGNFLITKENVTDFEKTAKRITDEMASTWADRFNTPMEENITKKRASENGTKRVTVILPEAAHDYWNLLVDGIEENLPSDISLRVERGMETNTDSLAEKIEMAVAADVDAIVTCAENDEDYNRILKKAKAKGIEIVLVESDIMDRNYCYVGIDNYEAGKGAAQAAVIATKGKGKIAIIGGIEALCSQKARIEGFKKTIKNFTNCEVVCEEYSNADPIKAVSLVQYIFKTHPETTVFFVTSPSDSEAVAKTVQNRSNKDIYSVITFDDSNNSEKTVLSGIVDASIGIDPKQMGKAAADSLKQSFANGESAKSFRIRTITVIK